MFNLDLSELTLLKLSTRLAEQTYHQCLCLGSFCLEINLCLHLDIIITPCISLTRSTVAQTKKTTSLFYIIAAFP